MAYSSAKQTPENIEDEEKNNDFCRDIRKRDSNVQRIISPQSSLVRKNCWLKAQSFLNNISLTGCVKRHGLMRFKFAENHLSIDWRLVEFRWTKRQFLTSGKNHKALLLKTLVDSMKKTTFCRCNIDQCFIGSLCYPVSSPDYQSDAPTTDITL